MLPGGPMTVWMRVIAIHVKYTRGGPHRPGSAEAGPIANVAETQL